MRGWLSLGQGLVKEEMIKAESGIEVWNAEHRTQNAE